MTCFRGTLVLGFRMVASICRLCGQGAELRQSHIIPRFVYQWLKDTSATGHFRFSQQPNLRVQDGLKIPMLCASCETRFNDWETKFATHVFHPFTAGKTHTAFYGGWMYRFCTSVSWRVLAHYLDNKYVRHLSSRLLLRATETECLWRQFLLGAGPIPEGTEQHFLPLGSIQTITHSNCPHNINRYILRSIDMDVASNKRDSVFVYAKLGPLVVLGFAEMPNSHQWLGTKLDVDHGAIQPRGYTIPAGFDDFLFEKSRKVARTQEAMSDRQKDTIDRAYRRDIDRAARSESFRAMGDDVRLFGDKAFDKK